MSFTRPLTAQFLTPYRHTALLALAEGPLDRTPDGWISRKGVEGLWNTVTITYLAFLGFCQFNHGKTTAGITNKGRQKIGLSADYAA